MDTQKANPITPLRALATAAGFVLLCPAQPAQAHVGLQDGQPERLAEDLEQYHPLK